jgi:prevent-host-death family protein
MSNSFSTWEAKARFSEILRMVRAGRVVRISFRGRDVAEIRPLSKDAHLEEHLARMEDRGILTGGREMRGELGPVVRRPGALKRFLAERE